MFVVFGTRENIRAFYIFSNTKNARNLTFYQKESRHLLKGEIPGIRSLLSIPGVKYQNVVSHKNQSPISIMRRKWMLYAIYSTQTSFHSIGTTCLLDSQVQVVQMASSYFGEFSNRFLSLYYFRELKGLEILILILLYSPKRSFEEYIV